MGRLLLILVAVCSLLSGANGAVAHGYEPPSCLDAAMATELGHTNGDSDEVPADSDRGFPHHHGGCHGHQTFDASTPMMVMWALRDDGSYLTNGGAATRSHQLDPTLRPPIS